MIRYVYEAYNNEFARACRVRAGEEEPSRVLGNQPPAVFAQRLMNLPLVWC